MIELCHLNVRHFVIEGCSHLTNGCITKCGCIGLMLFHYLSCMGAIKCNINTIEFVLCMQSGALVANCATVHYRHP